MADHILIDRWTLSDEKWSLASGEVVDSFSWDDGFSFTSYDLVDSWTFDDTVSAPIEQYVFVDSFTLAETVAVVSTDLDDYVDDLPDGLYEEPLVRTRRVEEREYGRVIIYGRLFTCAKGAAEDFEIGILAPGQLMRRQWADPDDAPSRYVDGPRVVATERQQQAGTAQDAIQVTYLAFLLPNSRQTGYNETARTQPASESALRSRITVYGITSSVRATGIPTKGHRLDGGRAICVQVSYNDTALPGRILVSSEYRLADEAADSLGFDPMPTKSSGYYLSATDIEGWKRLYGDAWRLYYRERMKR